MLNFSENFFREETKWGFTISKTMKHAWAGQMEVLQKVIDICEKYGLVYYAFGGTLLGAVRHEGFIPWDDDIDIAMKREDYQQFLKVVKNELPPVYCLLNVYEEEAWPHFHTRVTNSRKVDTSESRLSQFHGCPFVVGVDIFPLDYIPRDKGAAELQKTLLGIIRDLFPLLDESDKNNREKTVTERQEGRETLEEGLSALEEWCQVSIDRERNVANQLRRLFDRICMMYGGEDGDILTLYPQYIKDEGFFLSKEWFGTKQMKFENMVLTVPADYERVLTEQFGDYMVPLQNTQLHDYPFYKEQLQMLHERNVWLDVQE